jgi:alpha-amylase
MGGGFYEPIFTMLPDEDAAGQLAMMSDFLSRRFGRRPEGAWLPERVWEAGLVPVLAKAGVKYTVATSTASSVAPPDLDGAYLTEDRGELLRVFPLHEELRYAIPYKDPQWTIDYLQRYSDDAGRRTVVYADDGEKFGLWPNTKRHVYDEGWLDRFLDALEGAADRVRTVTFSEALKDAPSRRVYLPSTSYREMGEWSLPAPAQAEYESLSEELKRQNRFEAAKPMLLGGTWRGFKAKYPEANLMYGRMLHVSKKARAAGKRDALQELYRAQCNCGYWHGVFGGLHLPHLRGSVYRHLIAAEKLLEKNGAPGAEKLDLDLDGREDIRLHNPNLNVFITPSSGGHIVELDQRDACVNLVASLARRKEHYHTKLRQATSGNAEAKSIHDVVVSKVENLDRHLYYDSHPRASLVDHFFAPDATLDDVSKGWKEIGDFATGAYEAEPSLGATCALHRKGRVGECRFAFERTSTGPATRCSSRTVSKRRRRSRPSSA